MGIQICAPTTTHLRFFHFVLVLAVMEEAFQDLEVELPVFEGVDPVSWIARAEKIFEVHHVPEGEKMQLAFLSMKGEATHWFHFLCCHTLDLRN